MIKDERIGIRVPAGLKRALIQIAIKEEGHVYLQRLLSRQKKESSTE
jgi:hypothetical protein